MSLSCSFNTGAFVSFGIGLYTVIHCDSNIDFNRRNRLLVPSHPNPSRSKTLFIEDHENTFLASVFIMFSHISIHLPAGLSHWVTIPTISNLLSCANVSRKGTPIGADEKKTTR